MYHSLDRVQWCWVHVIRDIQGGIDSTDGPAKQLGWGLMRPITRMQPIREEVHALLRRDEWGPSELARPKCAELRKHEDRLLRFVDHEGIEPTNNGAERSSRQAGILRKLTFGTQSEAGSRFVETRLSMHDTCRQQGRSALAFVTATLQARYTGTQAPTLTRVCTVTGWMPFLRPRWLRDSADRT
jgi:transposase